MSSILIKNGMLVNRGCIQHGDLYIRHGFIERAGGIIDVLADREINAEGKYVMPGLIDDQVHFREPGLTHKADLYTESRAAVAGGVTSYMEMPNTKPPALTQALLEEKYAAAAQKSAANYSFFMGASNDNLDEVLRTDGRRVCGVKIFMGSSTGNMLVDDPATLEALFAKVPLLIATHCEDEAIVKNNERLWRQRFGEAVPMSEHPCIRSVEACLKSSALAVQLARQYHTRLHVLHISTEEELALFRNDIPLERKHITAEVCVHHLYFSSDDYAKLGAQIKCNPAIKAPRHRQALLSALLDDYLDIIATDHAPHTWNEKQNSYFGAPSGVPLVQHALQIMLSFYHKGLISLERIVEKMCHAPAICFRIDRRGFLDEGYWADVVIIDAEQLFTVTPESLHYKCGWSPLVGCVFKGLVETTIVSGQVAWHKGQFEGHTAGKRLEFSPEG